MTDCTDNICTTGVCSCPPNMAIVPTNLPTGGDYCVDYVEVTYKDYNDFWISNPSLLTQASFCSWNTTFTPANGWPPDLSTLDPDCYVAPPGILPGPPCNNSGYPVNWVNWCQAYAYCAQQGKRLCGKIGGGTNATADSANSMKSEWFNACSANSVNVYPYGSTYSGSTCNGVDFPSSMGGGIAPKAPLTPPYEELTSGGTLTAGHDACQGGAAGLYQMSGNVAEWEDSCSGTTGASDTCLVRGGSFMSAAAGLTCATAVATARNYQGADSGFRCCL
jgi:formylglycine-generating enzyme required for sulfatase activity